MSKQKFIDKRFTEQSQRLINVAAGILSKYADQGLDLSLRQLYYQLVATAYNQLPAEWIDPSTGSKNNEKSYKKIGDLINNARLAGLLDWDMLTDRGRTPDRLGMWDDPVDRLEWAAKTHRLDKWVDQPNYVWVMIEKQALEGVMIPVCRSLEIPFIANKGYSSASAMYEIGREFYRHRRHGQEIHVLYLGDHDPSGLDMTGDVLTRLELFSEGVVEVHRLALNMDQVQLYNPPPNPAKQTDSRYFAYVGQYGDECWELDALTPTVLRDLVRGAVEELRDPDIWAESLAVQTDQKDKLTRLAQRVKAGKVKLI
jgi:hypothetical protein